MNVKINNFLPLLPIVMGVCSLAMALEAGPVSIRLTGGTGAVVSKKLFGVNFMAGVPDQDPWTPDAAWQPEYLPKTLTEVGVGNLRYPGGHVTSFWHWDDPWWKPFSDLWGSSPETLNNKASRKSEYSKVVDLDEYITQCRSLKAEPVLGVNLLAGIKYGQLSRQEASTYAHLPYNGDSIAEAVAMLRYCRQMHFDVHYVYLDNEVGHQGGLPNHVPEEAYPELVKAFSIAQKKESPGVKIIVNYIHGLGPQAKRMVKDYGQYFDVVDDHFYYHPPGLAYKTFSRQAWMKDLGLDGHTAEFSGFTQYCQSVGQGHIQIACMEWNCQGMGAVDTAEGDDAPKNGEEKKSSKGKKGANGPKGNQFDQLLVVSEMIMMFVEQKVEMAAIWPLFWPGNQGSMVLADPDYHPRASFYALRLFKEMQGQASQKLDCDKKDMLVLSALQNEQRDANDTRRLVILLLSKSSAGSRTVRIDLGSLKAQAVSGFSYLEAQTAKGFEEKHLAPTLTNGAITLDCAGLSLTKITVDLQK